MWLGGHAYCLSACSSGVTWRGALADNAFVGLELFLFNAKTEQELFNPGPWIHICSSMTLKELDCFSKCD